MTAEVYFQDIAKSTTYVGSEPLTLADVKAHLYIDGTQDDTLVGELITQCRSAIEDFCHISIVPKSVTATISIDNVPHLSYQSVLTAYQAYVAIELPLGPVGSVSSVSWIDDQQNTNILVAGQDYFLRGASFQTLYVNNSYNNLIVVYETGYSVVPYALLLAIKNECSFRFENRGDGLNRYASQNVGLSEGAEFLATPYKRLTWL